MSRVGKAILKIPEKVDVKVNGFELTIKGPKGHLTLTLPAELKLVIKDGQLEVQRQDEVTKTRAAHGLIRNLISNMLQGVTTGFSKTLEINGVGYRAEVKGKDLNLSLGFSHPIVFPIPEGIGIKVNKQTELVIDGIDRQLVGEVAARIRRLRPPEPYKGKGIKYSTEVIIRKAGKSAA